MKAYKKHASESNLYLNAFCYVFTDTSSKYSSRSRAFLKSYSLAPRFSSQMYSWRKRETRLRKPEGITAWYSVCFTHGNEVMRAQQRHAVWVQLLLVQQLFRKSLLMKQKPLLLHYIYTNTTQSFQKRFLPMT